MTEKLFIGTLRINQPTNSLTEVCLNYLSEVINLFLYQSFIYLGGHHGIYLFFAVVPLMPTCELEIDMQNGFVHGLQGNNDQVDAVTSLIMSTEILMKVLIGL